MDAKPCNSPPEPPVLSELRALVGPAQAADAAALPRLRQILDEHPAVWRHVGDLTALVEGAWVGLLAAENPLAVEAMRRSAAEMRAELAGEHPTRLERMLVDEVVSCWLQLKYLEAATADPGKESVQQANVWLRRLNSAQRRYLSAAKAITTLRALLPNGLAPAGVVQVHEPDRQRA